MRDPVIGPYEKLPAMCLPYDPRAPEVARRVAEMIETRMPEVTVEHIGSTSAPGCAGKGVVDLLIVYRDAGQLEAIKRVLGELGFQRQVSRDPWPEDRPMRTGSLDHDGARFRLHVHVVPVDLEEPARDRAFRDRLRSDPRLLEAYVARKREIIEGGTTDSLDYSVAKGSFIEQALGSESS